MSWHVPSSTTIRFSSGPTLPSRYFCTTMPPNINTGMIVRAMRNALVATIARYSRRAMMRILRMADLLRALGLGTGNAHEDVVQRRPCQLEVLDLGSLEQRAEDRLGIGPMVHAELLVTPVVVDMHDAGQAREGAVVVVAGSHADRVLAVLGLDRLERAVEHLAPAADHQDRVAHALGDRHVVG